MKKISALILAVALLGCTATQASPIATPYRVTDPCLPTLITALYGGPQGAYEADEIGAGVAILKALQLYKLPPTESNIEKLTQQCVDNPEFTFIEAASVVNKSK